MNDQLEKEGVYVVSCFEGSAAQAAGAQRGDRILSVNGTPTPTIDEFINAERGQTYTIEVLRGSQVLTLTVDMTGRKKFDFLNKGESRKN